MGYIGFRGICWGDIGIMEKKMETTIMGYIGFRGICWGDIGIMEKKMENYHNGVI